MTPLRQAAGTVVLCLALALLSLAPLRAGADDGVDRLYTALKLPEMIALMRDEGMAQSESLAFDYLAFPPGDSWAQLMRRIYDPAKMEAAMKAAFRSDIEGAEIAPLIDFFQGETGSRIAELELDARRAFLDPATEEAARRQVSDPDTPASRLALIDRYIEVNDLVEFNVMGALNSNYRFYQGLTETGTFEMTDEEMLAEVWAQEAQTRSDTISWLRAFLLMAYEPLSDDDLRAYVDLSATEPGQRLNSALFMGFERMYNDVYHALGLAVAYQMSGQDL
ncbi:DUF2059 domain-containing protein [Pseudooceanicola sp. 216_PA32_1]|uniref:DUF2059 domain-containing protein n=1 Tax=Pseudooceanicola pacificus TaxID=2676438 RepID=A0A844W2S0_9RHOB|nr:DUF2059 domain-containing protein [Pseudooceanicola pacificus]MWB77385.1 DUF2059 domain-containing protein [Pseudooceanicola pacificus]